MAKRIIAAAAAVIFICSLFAALAVMYPDACDVRASIDTSPEGITDWSRVIAYVPLDDRVDNLETVVYMAEAAGYRIVMPEATAYATRLDGQGAGNTGTASGDRAALFKWVREMDDAGCNTFILSLDQLMSGGLVNSRAMTQNEAVTFADGTTMTETEAFDYYIMPLCRDEGNRVYLFDGVMRLASSAGYGGMGYRQYVRLRNYGMMARKPLYGDDLTVENIIENYPYGVNGQTFAWRAMENCGNGTKPSNADIADYLAARARKLRLLDYELSAMKTLTGGNTSLLVGIDDSSAGENIQSNELRYIQSKLSENVTLLPGMDSLARILVGSAAKDSLGGSVSACVRFFGGSEYLPATVYDHYSLVSTLKAHMELYGLEAVNESKADVEVLILTKPFSADYGQTACEKLGEKLKYNQAHNIPTIFIDASSNAYGEELWDKLFADVDLAGLLGYAGKYDLASVTGAGLAMGISRYACLARGESGCTQNTAHVHQMAYSMALTYAYIENSVFDVSDYITYRGYDPLNMYRHIPVRLWDGMLIYHRLNYDFLHYCHPLRANLQSGSVLTGLSPDSAAPVESIIYKNAVFPWNRYNEITFNVEVKLAEK